jgi:hypothetical protein
MHYSFSLVVKALGYKPEGRVFETRWDEWILSIYLILPGFLRFTQPLTEVSTGNIKKLMFLGSKVRPVREADKLTTIHKPIV